MQASLLRKPVAALCALSLLVLQPAAHAGDLNTEVTNMFNNLGAVGNYTAPGAFKGQTFNTFTGGNLYLRSPRRCQASRFSWHWSRCRRCWAG